MTQSNAGAWHCRAFRNNYAAALLAGILMTITSFAQVDTTRIIPRAGVNGQGYKNLAADSSAQFPQDTFYLKSSWNAIAFKDGLPYYWNNTKKWNAFGTGGGGGGSTKAKSGLGLSGDTVLLGVNAIDRPTVIDGATFPFSIIKIDSAGWKISNLWALPDSIYGVGSSFINPGTGASDINHAMLALAAASYGQLPSVNFGQSGAGTLIANKLFNAGAQPGHRGMVIATYGENTIRPAAGNRYMLNKLAQGLLNTFSNHNLKRYFMAGGSFVTRSAGWSTSDARSFGGKSVLGATTTTNNDSLYTDVNDASAVCIAFIVHDSVNSAGARGTIIIYNKYDPTDIAVNTTFGTNQRADGATDGINNNQKAPGAIVFNGLDPLKTYRVKVITNQGTNQMFIDYIGTLIDPAYSYPLIFLNAIHFTSAGYASFGGSDGTFDQGNAVMDSVVSYLAGLGFPVYSVPVNNTYNPVTMGSGDGVHPSNTGYATINAAILTTFPSLNVPRESTIHNNNGQLWTAVNRKPGQIGARPGPGNTVIDGVWNNDVIAGYPGGRTWMFGSQSGNGGRIVSNPVNNGVITIGQDNGITVNESTGNTGFNDPTPDRQINVLASTNSSDVIGITAAATPGNFINYLNSSNVQVGRVSGIGDLYGLGSNVAFGLRSDNGTSTVVLQSTNNAGNAYNKLSFHGNTYEFKKDGTTNILTANSSSVWFMPLTPTITDTTGYYFTVMKGSDGQISKIHFPFLSTPAVNIFNTNGSFTSNRTLDANAKTFSFFNGFDNILAYSPTDKNVTVGGSSAFVLADEDDQELILGGNHKVKIQDATLSGASAGYVWKLVNGTGEGQWAAATIPGLQSVITANPYLTTDNTLNNGTNQLTFTGSPSGQSSIKMASRNGGFPLLLANDHSSTNANLGMIVLNRTTSGTPANGIGAGIDYWIEDDTDSTTAAGSVRMKWTDVTHATRTSQFDLMGVNSASLQTYMNIQPGGIVRVDNNTDTLATLADVRNTIQSKGFSKSIYSPVGNVGAGEDDLMTYTVPAGLLATNGDFLEFEMVIQFFGSNSKTLKIYFGGQQLLTGGLAGTATGFITVKGTIIRLASSVESANITVVTSNATYAYNSEFSIPTQDVTSAVVLKATGTATTNNDIVQQMMVVKYFQGN